MICSTSLQTVQLTKLKVELVEYDTASVRHLVRNELTTQK